MILSSIHGFPPINNTNRPYPSNTTQKQHLRSFLHQNPPWLVKKEGRRGGENSPSMEAQPSSRRKGQTIVTKDLTLSSKGFNETGKKERRMKRVHEWGREEREYLSGKKKNSIYILSILDHSHLNSHETKLKRHF